MSMTVKAYLYEWLSVKTPYLERSTAEAYQIYIGKHLAPYFGEKHLADLRPIDVQRYVSDKLKGGRCDLKGGGLSRVSVRKHLNVLKQALSDAVVYEFLQSNPAACIKLPRVPSVSPAIEFLTIEQGQRLVSCFSGAFRLLVLMSLYYGLRRSEVIGLRWSSVDLEANTFTVEHTVVKNTTIECKDRTKTENSRRSFSLFPDVREGLEMLKMRQKTERAERITSGATYLESDYLFRHPDGRLFRPDYVTRAFERVARAEISPTFRFHDLRHATASILFERGWSVKDVQEWLGHADVETTLNIYVHYTRARKILLGNDFAGLLTKNKKQLDM